MLVTVGVGGVVWVGVGTGGAVSTGVVAGPGSLELAGGEGGFAVTLGEGTPLGSTVAIAVGTGLPIGAGLVGLVGSVALSSTASSTSLLIGSGLAHACGTSESSKRGAKQALESVMVKRPLSRGGGNRAFQLPYIETPSTLVLTPVG
jgi:hypothetical protein